MDGRDLLAAKELNKQRQSSLNSFSKKQIQYTQRNLNRNGSKIPLSSKEDYKIVDKNELLSIKAASVANLKINFNRGVKTHWILSSRNEEIPVPKNSFPAQPSPESGQSKRLQPHLLKEETNKKHFTFGNGPNHYSTTNMELLNSQQNKANTDANDLTVNTQNEKLKKMMRNHHFVFGSDKTDFCSTNDVNFSANDSNETKRVNLVKRSSSTSSVPLNVPNQLGVLKMKAIVQPTTDNSKSLKFFVQPVQKSVRDQKDLIIGTKRLLQDGYKSIATTSMVTLPDINHTNFINKVENNAQIDGFSSLKKSNFNLGSPSVTEMPVSLAQDTFKNHKQSYVREGVYKKGFKSKNMKSSVCL